MSNLMVYRLDKERYGEFISVPSEEMVLVYSGVFSFQYIYYMLHEWFVENKYCKSEDQDFQEQYITQRDSGGGKEIMIKWQLKKETEDKYVYEYECDLLIHAFLSQTEVLVDGKKVKLDKGEVEFKFFPRMRLDKDITNAWYMQNSRLKKWIEGKYFTPKVNLHFGLFDADLRRVRELIKEHFDIEKYTKGREILEYYKTRMGQ